MVNQWIFSSHWHMVDLVLLHQWLLKTYIPYLLIFIGFMILLVLSPIMCIILGCVETYLLISTGERPIVDILQDCRYWVIHVITIPALFLSGVVCVASGILFNVAGTANWLDYFSFVTSLSLLNDRFSLGIFV